ncbi:MAG: DUF1223 domain-containing protein [Phycisphaeraceae bacterium]|nr:DUF1223 domain-containing protein [Phycisphaeraceae bacterium]
MITRLLIVLGFFTLSLSDMVQAADHPVNSFVVVELFTSEGCSSCPPADRVLSQLRQEAAKAQSPVYTLAYHVDYWDRLGWEDRFSSEQWTQRQYQYAQAMRSRQVYTPQMIINGQHAFVGSRKATAEKHITSELAKKPAVNLELGFSQQSDEAAELDTVHWQIHPLPPNAQLHLVLAEDHLKTQVRRGENSGRQLHHDGVVRNMQTIKLINTQGKAMITIPQDAKRGHCRIIGLLQDQNSMRIMAGKQLTLRPIHE